MTSLSKFLHAANLDKFLFLLALVTVSVVRLGLTFTSYNFLKRLVPPVPVHRASLRSGRSIALAVTRAANCVPHASCLTQALSGQLLLALFGASSKIRLGVTRNAEGAIIAHAWLLMNDEVVLGGGPRSLSSYNVLTDLSV